MKTEEKKCYCCDEEAHFYWTTNSGITKDLCLKHYDELNRFVHQKEKQDRLINNTFALVEGTTAKREPIKCPIGEHCKYCAELKMTNPQ